MWEDPFLEWPSLEQILEGGDDDEDDEEEFPESTATSGAASAGGLGAGGSLDRGTSEGQRAGQGAGQGEESWPKGTIIDVVDGGAELQAWLDKMDGSPLAVIDWDAKWIEACRLSQLSKYGP